MGRGSSKIRMFFLNLISYVDPASMLAQTEIFGPVLVSSTFRTHDEAMALANNTAYGLAASVWSENINLALDVAPGSAGWSGSIVRTNSMHLPDSEVIGKAASAGKGGMKACSNT